jgi:hypothetical protein
MAEVFAAIGAWSPASPYHGPFGLGIPGRFEGLLRAVGFSNVHGEEVPCAFRYSDLDQALRGLLSAGPFIAAASRLGEEAVRNALTPILLRHRQPEGAIHLDNVFRLVAAAI